MAEPASASGNVLQGESGSRTLGATGCGASYDPWAFGPFKGKTEHEFKAKPETIGHNFTATFKVTSNWLFFGVDFYDASGNACDPGAGSMVYTVLG